MHTILEKLLEEISFNAPEHRNQTITITKEMVVEKLGFLVANQGSSTFIL